MAILIVFLGIILPSVCIDNIFFYPLEKNKSKLAELKQKIESHYYFLLFYCIQEDTTLNLKESKEFVNNFFKKNQTLLAEKNKSYQEFLTYIKSMIEERYENFNNNIEKAYPDLYQKAGEVYANRYLKSFCKDRGKNYYIHI